MDTSGINEEHLTALEQLGVTYAKARQLIDEQSKLDPVTQPHLSLWAGVHLLLDIIKGLHNILDDAMSKYILPKISPKIIAIVGGLWCEIGTIHMEIEEPTVEKHLKNCLDFLEKEPLNPDHTIPLIAAYNSLGLLYSQRDNLALSREYLEKAENIYIEFKKNLDHKPTETNSLFHLTFPITDEQTISAEKRMEALHTLTLFYLAQVYGKLIDHLQSAVYLHSTLKRQLESKVYDPIDWALNAATLSQYFTEKKQFTVARHHLSAASFVLSKHEAELNNLKDISEEELEAMKETYNHRNADVCRCWSKYGILLLSYSKDRLMADNAAEEEENTAPFQDQKSQMWFTSLNLTHFEEQVTNQHVLIFEDARKVFLNAQNWINLAKEYYSLENHASDYAELIQDHSELYRLLKFFEQDEARQCCMNKRRIDLIESVLKELNPQYYTNICRQLWYEVAQTYGEILDVKLEGVQSSDAKLTPHALRKINNLTEDSIRCYNSFLQTIKDSSTNEMPKDIPEELVRPALLAHFHIGRLCHKLITTDTNLQIENTQRSLTAYNYLVDYCATHEDAAKKMTLELGVIKNMVELLPLKIEKLRRQTPQM